MARKVKPGAFPDWLFDLPRLFPKEYAAGVKFCLWLCSGCGGPNYFRQVDGKHGGPTYRAKPHLSKPMRGPCWRSKEYGVECVTPAGARWIYHEGMPAVEQPDQPDAVWTEDNSDQEEGQYEW